MLRLRQMACNTQTMLSTSPTTTISMSSLFCQFNCIRLHSAHRCHPPHSLFRKGSRWNSCKCVWTTTNYSNILNQLFCQLHFISLCSCAATGSHQEESSCWEESGDTAASVSQKQESVLHVAPGDWEHSLQMQRCREDRSISKDTK